MYLLPCRGIAICQKHLVEGAAAASRNVRGAQKGESASTENKARAAAGVEVDGYLFGMCVNKR